MEREEERPSQINSEQEIEEIKLIDQDPYGPSYSTSAIQYLPYRIGIIVFAIGMIFLGQTNLVPIPLASPQIPFHALKMPFWIFFNQSPISTSPTKDLG